MQRGIAAVDDDHVAHRLVVELAPCRARRPDRGDERAGLEPRALQYRLHRVVTVQTMSAPRTAASASRKGVPPVSFAQRATFAGSRLQIRSSAHRPDRAQGERMGARSAPLPSMATILGPGGVSASAATADAAAVRSSVIQVPSMTATVRPVTGSVSTTVARSVGRLRSALRGMSVMSFVARALPASAGLRKSRPCSAGMSITRRSGWMTRRPKIDERATHRGQQLFQAEERRTAASSSVTFTRR